MPFEKKAVHFGGGNIGRGFVAEFLHKSDYEVVFVDVIDEIVEALQNEPSYTVTELNGKFDSKGNAIGEDQHIDHYRAINSKYNMDQAVHEIATADVVTCAVGPNILKFIGEPVAKAINARTVEYPLAVIACENAIGATNTWKTFIDPHVRDDIKNDQNEYSKRARFANSAIDRIVPHQDPAPNKLDVKIEEFSEWCVEQPPFLNGGKQPNIKGVHFVDNLEPYIERKLFTVNTSHATAAYYGYSSIPKIEYVHEVLEHKELQKKVHDAVAETALLIVARFPHITKDEQNKYVDSIIKRISNPALKDKVERVGRAPLRKLSAKERFIGPAAQIFSVDNEGKRIYPDLKADALLGGVEMALRFQNVKDDKESEELAEKLEKLSAEDAVKEITGIEEKDLLFAKLVPIFEKVKKNPGPVEVV